jgi:RNA polymerase sigma-70 factor, ECF subfamily
VAGATGQTDPHTPAADAGDAGLDAATVRSAQGGDRAAFNRLVLRFQDAVYTLCFRLSDSPEDAADATQEAFLSAYRHIADYRGGTFRSWLFRIAANACHDLHRQRKRRPAASLDSGGQDETPLDVADERPGPEAEALRGELGGLVQLGLAALQDDQRLALVLCDQYGYDYAAIAQMTEAELGTVKSRINRARRKMREFLLVHRELLPEPYRLTES